MIDPIQQAKDQEASDRAPFIAVHEIWTEYELQPDGSQKPVDWISWVKRGVQNPNVIPEKVSRLSKRPNDVWNVLKPSYDRWKSGQTAVVDGTPLQAWPGSTPQLVKALAPFNILSVEHLAEMEDSAIMKIGIPELRRKQKDARAFLEAQKSTAGVSAEVSKLRDENSFLRSELEQLKGLVKGMAAEEGVEIVDEPAPKRRGRPPKVKEAA